MTYIILFIAELLLGAIVGFSLSDNRKGLSVEEIKISSILFLISTALVFMQDRELTGLTYAHLAFSWLILIAGVMLGEMLKLRIINKIVSSIKKKDIQIAINEMVTAASQLQYVCRKQHVDELYMKLYQVQNMLNVLGHKSKKTQSKEFLNKLHYIFELCEDYVSLSVKLCSESAIQSDPTIHEAWVAIGKELTTLSWDTLNHAEETVKEELGKAFSVRAVKEAFHL